MLDKKYKDLTKIAIVIALQCLFPITAFAQSFEQNLSKIAALYDGKQFEELYKAVQPTKAKTNLKDVKLYMEAEALRNTNRKLEALKVYKELIYNYPESESALLSQMPCFMILLENAQQRDLPQLEEIAASLKSVWQKGTAFYKLSALPFLDIKQRSQYAYRSLYEFNAKRMFYQNAPASAELLKNIISNPNSYKFSHQEWLAIALWIINENLTEELYKDKANLIFLEANFGKTLSKILEAEYLNKQKKNDKAFEAFESVIRDKKNPKELIAWAHMLRGNAYYFNGRHAEALIDYKEASSCNLFPIDNLAIKYRSMRSFFECGKDKECLVQANEFIKKKLLSSLLPVHLYEMGLKSYDGGQYQRAVTYFMLLTRNFPGHYRADDALGYSALCTGLKTNEGKALLSLLKKKYPNSFFIYWLSPSSRKEALKLKDKPVEKLSHATRQRLEAMNLLWGTKLDFLAKSEANKLTAKHKSNLALFKAIIDIAQRHKDYYQTASFGERLSLQISEADKPLTEMPKWGWQAMYPLVYEKAIKKYGAKFSVDPMWAISIMREESHFKESVLSKSNAISLMQILPSTGKWIAGKLGEKGFKASSLWEPEVNIRYGIWYLKYLADLFNGDKYLATASYNGGQGNIQRKVEGGPHRTLPVLERLDKIPLPETRDYYKKVMGTYWNYLRLY